MKFLVAILVLSTSLLSAAAQAHEAVQVGNAIELAGALRRAEPNEEILLAPGKYKTTDIKIRQNVTLKGEPEGEVIFLSARPVAKGLINPMPGISLRVENITFKGARSPDKNGAGIRHDGKNLTIINCKFIGNENGVLATGASDGEINITGSSFVENGHGDGYSHGIYVYDTAALTITESNFSGTKIGHHVKSLAARTEITGNTFDDADGRTSYTLDVSKGGDVTVTGNTITQAADADNSTIINYDLTRGGEAVSLLIENNTIINAHRSGKLLRNDTDLSPIIRGNTITNKDGGRLRHPTQSASETKLQTREETAPMIPQPSTPGLQQPASEKQAPKSGKRTGLIKAPVFNRDANALVPFKLVNNWKDESAPDYFTFGQAFPEGALTLGEKIAAQFGDKVLAAQIDVKALHEDGSVRHAAVTIQTPALKSGGEIEGALIIFSGATQEDFDALTILESAFDFRTALTFYDGDGNARTAVYNPRDLALKTFGSSTQSFWLDGSLVKEARIEMNGGPHLAMRFDIRIYRDGDIRTSVVFANEKTFSPGRREMLYDVTIGNVGDNQWRAEQVFHHRSSTWRKTFWTGEQPKLHIVHDLETLIASNAVAPLDPSIGVSGNAITFNANQLEEAPAPLSPVMITPYFPTTGGRSDIGVYTQWAAHYLVVQTETSKRVMLANANAAGAVPWHFVDEQTGAPVSLETRPKFWADSRGLEEQYAPDRAHPDLFESDEGGWTIDHAHKPALTYVPYLVTADRYYADELAMQGAWALFGRWPHLREGGLKVIDVEQVRASAWSLRDMSDAAYLLPDNHPSKDYLNRALETNLRLAAEKYINRRAMKAAGELEGYFEEYIDREPERISPWQNDFMIMSLWLAAQRGEEAAARLIGWAKNFHVGRVLSEDINIKYAAAYQLPAREAATQKPRATWAEIATRLHETKSDHGVEMLGYPNIATGYVGLAYGALTAVASSTADPTAFEALAQYYNETKHHLMWDEFHNGGVADENNFLFSLALPDGGTVTRKDLRRSKFRTEQNNFLIGDKGQDTLTGGSYSDVLIGFDGDDVLEGSKGPDILAGGAGNDRLSGGPGSDRMSGGPGADIFIFSDTQISEDPEEDIIFDFDPGADRLALKTTNPDMARRLMRYLESTTQGARFSFEGNNHSVLLSGVPVSALNASNFMLIQ